MFLNRSSRLETTTLALVIWTLSWRHKLPSASETRLPTTIVEQSVRCWLIVVLLILFFHALIIVHLLLFVIIFTVLISKIFAFFQCVLLVLKWSANKTLLCFLFLILLLLRQVSWILILLKMAAHFHIINILASNRIDEPLHSVLVSEVICWFAHCLLSFLTLGLTFWLVTLRNIHLI